MKRLIFTMIVICACQMSFAQNTDAIYNEFKDVKGANAPFFTFCSSDFRPHRYLCIYSLLH